MALLPFSGPGLGHINFLCRPPASIHHYTYHDFVRQWDLIALLPPKPLGFLLYAPMPSVRSMEYPANMLDSTKSSDEKNSFEDVTVGIPTTGRTTSATAANVTRYISEKLLDWGVEERGVYRYLRFPRSRL
jgi:hypothetical protein